MVRANVGNGHDNPWRIAVTSEAPWLALASDWMDSEMFDDATDNERLAWIMLLCYAKERGRSGRVRFRTCSLARHYKMSVNAIQGMLHKAKMFGAVTIDGDLITICNWRDYQDKNRSRKGSNEAQSGETSEKSPTHHPPPSTHHPSPTTKDTPPNPPGGGPGEHPSSGINSSERFEADPIASRLLAAIPERFRTNRTTFTTEVALAIRDRGVDEDTLQESLTAYYASPAGSGQWARQPPRFVREQGWLEPREAWQHGSDRSAENYRSPADIRRAAQAAKEYPED